MKKIQTKSGNIRCVEIPEDSSENLKRYYNLELDGDELLYVNKVIGKLSELTDKDCGEFVELTNTGLYKIYDWSEKKVNELGIQPVTNFAKKSFLSLLESEGIDTSKEYLIIRLYYDRYSN